MMTEEKGPVFIGFGHHLHIPFIRQSQMAIVIALDKKNVAADRLPPARDGITDLPGQPFLSMHKIAEKNEPLNLQAIKDAFQFLQILMQDRAAHRNAGLLKNLGLSPVQVRHHQSSALWPVDGFFAEEREDFALDFPLDCVHEFLILSIRSASCSEEICALTRSL